MAQTLTITLDDAGNVSVTGPIDSKVLVYGLLACARDAIAEHHAAKAQRLVQAAPPGLMLAGGH